MRFIKVKTRPFLPPKDNIYNLFDQYLPRLHEGDILIITSKILGIHQGRCVKIKEGTIEEKDKLIMKEAEWYVRRDEVPDKHAILTIQENTLVSSAGMDESNGNGYYLLWPKNQKKLIREIWQYLKKKFKIKNLGIIVIDSHLIPLRTGTVGISTGFTGFEPLIDYRGKEDIFGRKMEVTQANIVDSLAAMAGLLMGESNARTPLLVIRGLKFVRFTDKNTYSKLLYPRHKDIFLPLLKVFKRNKK